MVSVQPVHLWTYLSLKRSQTPKGVKALFYLSWEDALWDLLLKKRIPCRSVILVPSFFCVDVEQNMRAHGYRVEHYDVSINFQTSQEVMVGAIKKYSPSVVVVFHAVGISNTLLSESHLWMQHLTPETLLIEDCVHRIVNPNEVKILRTNHFILDSLRKVLPIQGGVLYGNVEDLPFDEPPILQGLGYAVLVTSLWFLMLLCWTATQLVPIPQVSAFFAHLSESLMKRGYDLIGDSTLPARGWRVFHTLQQHIDHTKMSQSKIWQVKLYEGELVPYLAAFMIVPKYTEKDRGNLRGFPIIVTRVAAKSIAEQLRAQGLYVRLELEGCAWTKDHAVFYLPLGPYLSESQVLDVAKLVRDVIIHFVKNVSAVQYTHL